MLILALDGMSPKQRHGKTGMRLQMHLAKILGGDYGVGVVIDSPHEPVHDQDATKA